MPAKFIQLRGTRKPASLEVWQGYRPSDSLEQVTRQFKERYGAEPENIVSEPAIILAGPIPEKALTNGILQS